MRSFFKRIERNSMERLQQQLNFLLEMDKEKSIKRQTRCTDHHMENDAEHAWHIALACLILSEYANEKIDVFKTVAMLLIHDVVEIDAGDTYAYDTQGQMRAHDKETKACNRLFSLLPSDQKKLYIALWKEFEENETKEANFAHAMDNLMPVLLNNQDDGYMWRKNEVPLSKILKRQENTKKGSEYLYGQIIEILKQNIEKHKIVKDCEI